VVPPQSERAPSGSTAVAPARPADGIAVAAPPGGTDITAAPRAAIEAQPQPPQNSPAQEPLPALEIKSRPVAAVDAPPAPSSTQAGAADPDGGLFSAIKKIPELLRSDTPAADGEPPRPPLPVGQ
jgi:hypothetical protein